MEVGLKGHLIPAPDGGRNFEAVLFNFFFRFLSSFFKLVIHLEFCFEFVSTRVDDNFAKVWQLIFPFLTKNWQLNETG